MTILDALPDLEIRPPLSEVLIFVVLFSFAFITESGTIAFFLAWRRGEFTFEFLASPPVVISIGLTAWIVALLAFVVSRIRSSANPVLQENAANQLVALRSRHAPSASAFENVLLALITMCGVSNRVEVEKAQWIEMLYARWVDVVGEGQGRPLDSDVIITLVRSAATPNGSATLLDLLKRNGRNSEFKDKQVLLRCCFLLATIDGNVSSQQCEIILKIVRAIDFPTNRLLELASADGR